MISSGIPKNEKLLKKSQFTLSCKQHPKIVLVLAATSFWFIHKINSSPNNVITSFKRTRRSHSPSLVFLFTLLPFFHIKFRLNWHQNQNLRIKDKSNLAFIFHVLKCIASESELNKTDEWSTSSFVYIYWKWHLHHPSDKFCAPNSPCSVCMWMWWWRPEFSTTFPERISICQQLLTAYFMPYMLRPGSAAAVARSAGNENLIFYMFSSALVTSNVLDA